MAGKVYLNLNPEPQAMPMSNTASRCPLCGGEPCETLAGCQDLFHKLPGRWTYQRCISCRSLWMDPLPRPEEIPGFYPAYYYTHTSREDGGPDGQDRKFAAVRLAVNYAVLEKRWGYGIPQDWWDGVGGGGWQRAAAQYLPSFAASRMVRFLPFSKRGRLLDIGCANGHFLSMMRQLGWEVEGVEPDEAAASLARKKGLSVFQGSVEAAPLAPDSYDAITMSHVIEHLLEPRAVLERCVAALRPGGILMSGSPNPEGRNARVLREIWMGMDPPRHLIVPSFSGYRALLADLPVNVNLFTSPLNMGFTWWLSRQNAGRTRLMMLQRLRAWAVDWIAGPLWVAWQPHLGEEVICLATKHR